MANTITDLIPKILTEAAVIFRNNSITANMVNRGYDGDFRKKGDTINVPSYTSPSVQSITAGRGNENTPTDIVASNVSVTLSEWKEVKIQFSDKELKQIEEGRPSEALEKAVIALADHVDTYVLAQMGVKGYKTIGTAGSAFADPDLLSDSSVQLGLDNVPKRDRYSMINPTVAGAMAKHDDIRDVSKSGNDEALRDAEIGKIYSFDNYETNNLTDFTGGTLSDGSSKAALVAADAVVGATSISFDETTLTGTLVEGDIFTIAGDTQKYVVTTGGTAAANAITVSFTPALKIAADDGDAVSFQADYTSAGLAFHKDAYIFGTAPVDIGFTGGNLVEMFTDPVSGITFTYEVERVGKSTEHSLSILYGGEVLKTEGIVRLLS